MTSNRGTESKISVVHLLHTVDYGGVETIIINWLRALQSDQVQVSIVCFANPGNTERLFVEAAEQAGFEVDTIPWSRRKPLIKSSNSLKAILARRNASIVHTHNTYADLVGLITAKRMGLRTVSSLYVLSSFGWKRKTLEWITLQALRQFDCVTAQCEATRSDIIAGGIPSDKVKLLHSGYKPTTTPIDTVEMQQKRLEHGVDPDTILMVNVARLYPEKAHATLLREFRKIHDEYPNTKLWILGRGPLEAEVKGLCTELGLDDAVWFPGYVPNFYELTQLADIQLHPSYTEGIPMAILSGMAAGLPIVASNVGGIEEVLPNDVRGLLVPSAGNETFGEKFRTAVKALINDPGLRKRLGESASEYIRVDYSLERAASRLEEIYMEVLAS